METAATRHIQHIASSPATRQVQHIHPSPQLGPAFNPGRCHRDDAAMRQLLPYAWAWLSAVHSRWCRSGLRRCSRWDGGCCRWLQVAAGCWLMGDTEHGARRTAYRTAYRTGYCDRSSGSALHEHGIPCAGLLGGGGSWAVAGSCLVTAVLCAGVAVSWGRVGEGRCVHERLARGRGTVSYDLVYRIVRLLALTSRSPHSTPLPTDFSANTGIRTYVRSRSTARVRDREWWAGGWERAGMK